MNWHFAETSQNEQQEKIMNDEEIHEAAVAAAEAVVNKLGLNAEERNMAIEKGVSVCHVVQAGVAATPHSRDTVSAILAAALAYNECYWRLHDGGEFSDADETRME